MKKLLTVFVASLGLLMGGCGNNPQAGLSDEEITIIENSVNTYVNDMSELIQITCDSIIENVDSYTPAQLSNVLDEMIVMATSEGETYAILKAMPLTEEQNDLVLRASMKNVEAFESVLEAIE